MDSLRLNFEAGVPMQVSTSGVSLGLSARIAAVMKEFGAADTVGAGQGLSGGSQYIFVCISTHNIIYIPMWDGAAWDVGDGNNGMLCCPLGLLTEVRRGAMAWCAAR